MELQGKKNRLLARIVLAGCLAMPGTRASSDIMADTLTACSVDIERLCPTVSSGGGRVFACIMAHEGEVSPRCADALDDASEQLRGLMNTMTFIGESCHVELGKYCADTEMGEGRIAACLKEHYDQSTPTCREALRGVGITD